MNGMSLAAHPGVRRVAFPPNCGVAPALFCGFLVAVFVPLKSHLLRRSVTREGARPDER
jgi:hypothetical protein